MCMCWMRSLFAFFGKRLLGETADGIADHVVLGQSVFIKVKTSNWEWERLFVQNNNIWFSLLHKCMSKGNAWALGEVLWSALDMAWPYENRHGNLTVERAIIEYGIQYVRGRWESSLMVKNKVSHLRLSVWIGFLNVFSRKSVIIFQKWLISLVQTIQRASLWTESHRTSLICSSHRSLLHSTPLH